jgi:hypothetical protein
MLVPEEFAQLLDELNRNELPYVVVGGVAVNLLGFVALKRLAGRPQDREDLSRLEEAYGLLPDVLSTEASAEDS